MSEPEPRSHYVDVGGLSLHVEERGEGPPVLFGHSLLCDRRMFEAQVADLARDHRVLNVDLRGHGLSDPATEPYGMAEQGEDYRRIMDALDVDRAFVAGLSMGGTAAVHLALAHPDRVRGLVVMDASVRDETATGRVSYAAMAALLDRVGFRPFLAKQAARTLFGRTFRRHHPDEVERWMARMRQLPPSGVAHAVRMLRDRPDLRERLPEVRVPSLFVVGDEDTAISVPTMRDAAHRVAHGRIEALRGVGHLATIEAPEETARLLRDFIAPLDRQG